MRTMKQSPLTAPIVSNRRAHPQLRLSCPNGAIILEPISIVLAWSGFYARAFCAHCCMRTLATHAQSGYRSACLTSKLFRVHSHSTSHKSLHGKPEQADAAQTMSRFCKKWQKFAVVNGLSTPKSPQRCFVFVKPQVTIYRRREQCIPYRAQPQIRAKKLTIRTKYQARANCSRRHQQQTRSKPGASTKRR